MDKRFVCIRIKSIGEIKTNYLLAVCLLFSKLLFCNTLEHITTIFDLILNNFYSLYHISLRGLLTLTSPNNNKLGKCFRRD